MESGQTAITVENLSKRYRIGLKEELNDSLLKVAVNILKSPFANFRKYRSLYKFDDLKDRRYEANDMLDNSSDIIWALKNVSFEIKSGEAIGIIGGNGAGKSTLLKILSRITEPTEGFAEIHGKVSSLLEVGTGFHPELTGRENVYLNGTILGMKKREINSKFDEIVDFSGVEKFIDTPVKRYSSGMLVRLAFSVAAHLEPEILVIDEVLAVGDADFQKKCLKRMEAVGQEGRTVLFVSHNLPAVTRLCNRAILLEEGKMLFEGPSTFVVNKYLNKDTGNSAHREWHDIEKAPGKDVAKLRAVKIKDHNGKISDSVDIRKEFTIEMEYNVIRSGFKLLPNFGLVNEEGLIIFISIDQDPNWKLKPRPKGRYVSKALIPGNLLSEGILYVNCCLNTIQPQTPQFAERSIIAFMITDSQDGDSARGDYTGKLLGVVRPLLKWTTDAYLSE